MKELVRLLNEQNEQNKLRQRNRDNEKTNR